MKTIKITPLSRINDDKSNDFSHNNFEERSSSLLLGALSKKMLRIVLLAAVFSVNKEIYLASAFPGLNLIHHIMFEKDLEERL